MTMDMGLFPYSFSYPEDYGMANVYRVGYYASDKLLRTIYGVLFPIFW